MTVSRLEKFYNVHLAKCPVCETNRWEYYGGRYHFGLRIEYWICPRCALVGQSPRLDGKILPEFYTNFYRELYEGDAKPTKEEFEFQQKRGRNLLQIFVKSTGKENIGKILDFGCSAGGLLAVAVKEFGATFAAGIELDAEFSSLARKLGFHVYSTFQDIKSAWCGFFDLITLSHVLEHISNPYKLIVDLSRLLAFDGFLCIEVPHSCEGGCFQIAHLWGFNESSLSWLLANAGFETISMSTHGYPRVPHRSNSYLVAIAKRSHGPINSHRIYRSTAHRERMRRYMSHSDDSWIDYQKMLVRNTIKQLLDNITQKRKLVAYSYFPTKLKDWKRTVR